jgi:hypothetical protein
MNEAKQMHDDLLNGLLAIMIFPRFDRVVECGKASLEKRRMY